MQLYYAKGTIAIAAAIALQEAGLDHTTARLDFGNADQTGADYLRTNPKGRVPALVLNDGTVLTECGAILEFIASQSPRADLVPDDAIAAAHMRMVMYYLASTMHVAHAHKMRGSRWADAQSSFDDMKNKVPETMRACARYVENECLRGDYVLGDRFSIADCYLFIACGWLPGDGVDLAEFPKITAYLDRINARDSVKAVRAADML
ncbi:glutathione S-transferase family protein [Sulfitobacter sp. S190]|uniref:glutathione S-transferase family protein n=1 Tax=Sulfitobacter sp. S190 TaxID=2867022 RepID=UPI0021A6659A|nr:glutathione S-transferase family protein [Sulfitobacter sp. S190]UWR22173.1 glutathione S-transferase family protein [Sulfitobacter sp. S190]